MNKMKIVGIGLVALALLLFLTQPSRLPSILLIIPFALIFLVLLLIFQVLFSRTGRDRSKSLRFALAAASLPVILLAMQSVGQLTLRDLATIVALFVVFYFYIYRTARSNT